MFSLLIAIIINFNTNIRVPCAALVSIFGHGRSWSRPTSRGNYFVIAKGVVEVAIPGVLHGVLNVGTAQPRNPVGFEF